MVAPLLWLAAHAALPLWSVWLLLARELLISGWRGPSDGAPASLAGKAKTVLQFLSLLLLLWPEGWSGHAQLVQAGWWIFWPSLLLALSSATAYIGPNQGPISAEVRFKARMDCIVIGGCPPGPSSHRTSASRPVPVEHA